MTGEFVAVKAEAERTVEIYRTSNHAGELGGGRMLNLGSSTIVKLIKHGERYHVLAQGQSGKIYHSTFSSEEEARSWINEHTHQPVKLEEV